MYPKISTSEHSFQLSADDLIKVFWPLDDAYYPSAIASKK